ncbi:MAG: hypothetical protein AB7E72_08840 [Lysobacterales bacterium]
MTRALLIAAAALLPLPTAALADDNGARFQMREAKVETTAPATSSDGRYALHGRAQWSTIDPPVGAARFSLKSSNGTSCTATGDAVFANGFE